MGTFMDQLAVQVLTLPIVYPLIVSLGFDPYWFAIVFVKTVEIGLITPPLGFERLRRQLASRGSRSRRRSPA